MLDGEANQTAVRKLIQKCYMEDSSSRSLGLLSHVRPYSFKGCWSYKAASLMLWIYTRKHVIQSSLTEQKLNVFRRKVNDPLTTVKARVKNDDVANALIQYQWRPKSYITVCSLLENWDLAVSTSNSPKADFGMAHQVIQLWTLTKKNSKELSVK